MQHPRFRAAYDLLLLRENAGEISPGLGEWWTAYQAADPAEREQMCQQLGQKPGAKKRRRYNNRRRGNRSHTPQ